MANLHKALVMLSLRILAVIFNRSKVFCSFLWVDKNNLLFSCVSRIYYIYLQIS